MKYLTVHCPISCLKLDGKSENEFAKETEVGSETRGDKICNVETKCYYVPARSVVIGLSVACWRGKAVVGQVIEITTLAPVVKIIDHQCPAGQKSVKRNNIRLARKHFSVIINGETLFYFSRGMWKQ